MNYTVDHAQPHRLQSSAVDHRPNPSDGGVMLTSFPSPIRLLEFNRPAHSPWLTVPLAEEEIAIQDAHEAEIVRFDHHDAVIYAGDMGLPTEFPL